MSREDYQIELSRAFGDIARIWLNSDRSRNLVSSFYDHVWFALKIKQYYIWYNKNSEPVGYILWAFVDEVTVQSFTSNGPHNIHPSQWNEGDIIWIMDIVSRTKISLSSYKLVRAKLFASVPVYALKPKKDGFKVIRSSFRSKLKNLP